MSKKRHCPRSRYQDYSDRVAATRRQRYWITYRVGKVERKWKCTRALPTGLPITLRVRLYVRGFLRRLQAAA